MNSTIRIGSANTGSEMRKTLDSSYRGKSPAGALEQVDCTLNILEELVHKAGAAGCDVVAFSEDTLAINRWSAGNWEKVGELLPHAVTRMLERLGQAAASHNMYLLCCSDALEDDAVYNTAYFLGRDGAEIGRYHKVFLPVFEQLKKHGEGFPVFETPDLGSVGMTICYDIVFPESVRCLALGGAEVVFNLTLGGAAFGGDEISHAAFRTRAAENFVYLVVSWGAWGTDTGSMILSPKGEILVEEMKPGEVAIAEIDPTDGRQVEGWSNRQEDMRARVFRELRPEACQWLTDSHPPILDKLPPLTPGTPEEIARIVMRAKTFGSERLSRAETYAREGKIDEAIEILESMKVEFAGTWYDTMSTERLAELQGMGDI